MPVKFTAKYERIAFDEDNYLDIRGLNLPDISALVDAHADTVSGLFDKFTGRDAQSFGTADAATLARELIVTFPAVCAHIVALAADAIDEFDTIKTLPIDVQVTALEKIANRTFAMQGGLGKFLETVLRMAQGANGLTAKSKSLQASMNGSAASIGK